MRRIPLAAEMTTYKVWDAGVRWFHWINVLCLLGLIAVGTAILNDSALGVDNDGKVLLKTVHVWIGYVFALNLLWRLLWAFVGGKTSRWRAILPGKRGYLTELRRYLAALRDGRPMQFLAHNPLGRVSITCLLLLMLIMAVTGLALAGTDLFYPPLGSWIASSVAAPGVDPATVVPYAPEMYDREAYASMRTLRAPIVRVHLYAFYALLVAIVLHIAGVVVAELRDEGNLVSAMFSGKKTLKDAPVDEDVSPRA